MSAAVPQRIALVLLAAVADNGVIGRDNALPWRLSTDLKRFKAITLGKPVVMGRKTYDSLHIKPLPNRTSIVVTRDKNFTAPGVIAAQNLDAALEAARGDALRRGSDIMVIGGADIYAQAMPFADRLEITLVHATPEGDTRFPGIDPAIWRETARTEHPRGEGDDAAYDFVSYLRTNGVNPKP